MPKRHKAILDRLQNLLVGLDFRARERFFARDDGREGVGVEDLPRAFVGCDGEFLVCGVGEPCGVDDGEVGGAGGADGDVAAGEGRD
jgi:hypothetical protein